MHRYQCALTGCGWVSQPWPAQWQAGSEATWHVYDHHREHWRRLFGERPPRDPHPNTLSGLKP